MALFGMILSLVLAVSNLSLETDWLILFSPEHPEIKTLEYWRDNLPGSKDLAVIVSRGDLKTRQRAVDQLGLSFAKHPEVLSSPLYSIDAKIFLHSGLYFLSKKQLLGLDNDLRTLLSGIRRGSEKDPFQVDSFADSLVLAAPGADLVLRFMKALEESTRADLSDADISRFWPAVEPESSKVREMMGSVEAAPPERIYLSLDGGQTLLVLVSPNIGDQNLEAAAPSVKKVREILEGMREQYPTVTFSLTGEPVLVVDERLTIAQDSVRSTLCSLFLVLALFHFGFREVARPALALVTLIVGLVWTLGAVSLAVGHLNFITVTYIPILVGIGIDFGIHIGFRYFECKSVLPGPEAIEQTMRTAGKDTLIGAMATSVAFGVLILVGFRGVAELGLIAFLGVLLCQFSACTCFRRC